MNNLTMFEFAMENWNEWKRTGNDTYRIAWETARYMIYLAGLWNEWIKYCDVNKEKRYA